MNELNQIVKDFETAIEDIVFIELKAKPNSTRKEMVQSVNTQIQKHLTNIEESKDFLSLEDFQPLVKKVVYGLVAP